MEGRAEREDHPQHGPGLRASCPSQGPFLSQRPSTHMYLPLCRRHTENVFPLTV